MKEITVNDLLSRMNSDQLESLAQSLYDDCNFNGNAKDELCLHLVSEEYLKLTGHKVELTYNCAP